MTEIRRTGTEEEFVDNFTLLTAGVANLLLSGIDVNSEVIGDIVTDFLNQYIEDEPETPVPAPPVPEKPQGPIIGYVIRRKSDQRVMYFDGKPLHDGGWTALSHLMLHVPDTEMRKNYEVVPVRTDG